MSERTPLKRGYEDIEEPLIYEWPFDYPYDADPKYPENLVKGEDSKVIARFIPKAGFDPHQRRDRYGRWTDEFGGGPSPDVAASPTSDAVIDVMRQQGGGPFTASEVQTLVRARHGEKYKDVTVKTQLYRAAKRGELVKEGKGRSTKFRVPQPGETVEVMPPKPRTRKPTTISNVPANLTALKRDAQQIHESTDTQTFVDAGRRIDELAEDRVAEQQQELDAQTEKARVKFDKARQELQARRLELMNENPGLSEYGIARSGDSKQKRLLAKCRKTEREYYAARREARYPRAAALQEVLSELRPMGGKIEMTNKRGELVQHARKMQQYFPRDWIEAVNRNAGQPLTLKRTSGRAFYRKWGNQIKARPSDSSMIHEMGHMFTYFGTDAPTRPAAGSEITMGRARSVVGDPPLKALNEKFKEERTAGETAVPMRSLAGTYGYGAHEMTKPDKFADQYVGSQQSNEIFTMGLEGAFFGAHNIRGKDPEHYYFTLGLLGFV